VNRTRSARVGPAIGLIVVGLALALAVANRIEGIDLTMIGWIVAGAGVLWLVIELFNQSRANAPTTISSRTSEQVDPTTGARVQEHVQEVDPNAPV
jgi:hypothetical protein